MLNPCPEKGGEKGAKLITKNEYREKLADSFVKAIEEEGLNWKKGWMSTEAPSSAITGIPYKGINRFVLTMESINKGYTDSRWATFKQIQDKGWHLEKGSKGVQIEFWLPLDPETGKPTTWDKINELKKQNPDIEVKSVPQYYYVYNADKIKGIPERQINRAEVKVENIVPKISKNMGVEILNDGGDRAFYRPSEDKIHLPEASNFLSSYDYYATAMHELSHATGAPHRLNRDLSGIFGTPSYAFEELVAEMSSAFMSEHLPYELPEEQLESHKAYLQSWMQAIKDNPDYLAQAIRKADECANYLEEMGEIQQELQKELQQEKVVNNVINAGEQIEMYYYTENLGGTGIDKDALQVKYEDFESASKAFMEADLTDGKTIGIHIDGVNYELSYYDSAINSFVLENNLSQMNYWNDFKQEVSDGISYDDFQSIQENINTLNHTLERETAYTKVLDGFRDVFYDAQAYIINQESLWGSWDGRIVNDKRPQDYVQVEIMGYSKHKEISATITSVHANEVVEVRQMDLKLPEGNFVQAVDQTFEQIGSFFSKDNNYIKEAAYNLNTDYNKPFTLYAPFVEKGMDEHYIALGDRGYQAFPDYDNWNRQQSEKVDISLSDNVKQVDEPALQEPKELSEKKTDLIRKVVELDVQKMELLQNVKSINNTIEGNIQEIIADDILNQGHLSSYTKQMMEVYSVGEEIPYLTNVQQLDKAKGDIHIFQDKTEPKKNYLGKKIEKNGVKMIQKLSEPMELTKAREKLKEMVKNQPEQNLQKQVKMQRPAVSFERGR